VPLAIVPGLLLVWNVAASRPARAAAVRRVLLFAAGSVPACLIVAALNNYWYGSPLQSGYGTLAGTYYRWEFLWPNLWRYGRWLLDSESPLILLAAAAPFLVWRPDAGRSGRADARPMVAACIAFASIGYLCYAFYLPFDAWWFLRFLLPGFPMLMALVSAVMLTLAARLPVRSREWALVVILSLAVSHNLAFARRSGSFDSDGEWRFATAGRYIAEHLPARAILLSMHHSGSARYYSGRPTLRYDHIAPTQLTPVVAQLRAEGYVPYILLDDWEQAVFTARFAGDSLGALDWPPAATLPGVMIYAARDGAAATGEPTAASALRTPALH
jgi:hypothetical protein